MSIFSAYKQKKLKSNDYFDKIPYNIILLIILFLFIQTIFFLS